MDDEKERDLGAKFFLLDQRDALEARSFDDLAIARLKTQPAAVLAASAILNDGKKRPSMSTTRGPEREAFALVSKSIDPRAANWFGSADALYWTMVDRHSAVIAMLAGKLSRKTSIDLEEIESTMKIGWYRAAIRWDPSRDVRFPTYGGIYGSAAVQRSIGAAAGVHVPAELRTRNLVRVQAIHVGDDRTMESVIDTRMNMDGVSTQDERMATMELGRWLQSLSAKDRAVVKAWADGVSMETIGHTILDDTSRETARKRLQAALRRLKRKAWSRLGPG